MAGWQRSTRRPPDHDNVDKHYDDDDNDDHRGAAETNAGESDGANCYLAPFKNTTIWYVVTAMVEWPRVAETIVVEDLNVDLERTGVQ